MSNFYSTVKEADDNNFKPLLKKTPIGVACGVYFSEAIRFFAKSKGLIAVYPSGGRYVVEISENTFNEKSKHKQTGGLDIDSVTNIGEEA